MRVLIDASQAELLRDLEIMFPPWCLTIENTADGPVARFERSTA